MFQSNSPLSEEHTTIQYISDNKVPSSLLFLLASQFVMIIIDRVLYLLKNLRGKVIFHVLTVIYIHGWIFVYFPIRTGEKLNRTVFPIIFYFLKCIYLIISAYQIRCGYPRRILGNFLMKNYNWLSFNSFRL